MKWKADQNGNVAAAPLEDWLIGLHGEMLVFQLRYHSGDEQGLPLVKDQPFAVPAGLAELLAKQILECIRTGEQQVGNPDQPIPQ